MIFLHVDMIPKIFSIFLDNFFHCHLQIIHLAIFLLESNSFAIKMLKGPNQRRTTRLHCTGYKINLGAQLSLLRQVSRRHVPARAVMYRIVVGMALLLLPLPLLCPLEKLYRI